MRSTGSLRRICLFLGPGAAARLSSPFMSLDETPAVGSGLAAQHHTGHSANTHIDPTRQEAQAMDTTGNEPAVATSPSRRLGTGWDPTILPWIDGQEVVLIAGDWHGTTAWA